MFRNLGQCLLATPRQRSRPRLKHTLPPGASRKKKMSWELTEVTKKP